MLSPKPIAIAFALSLPGLGAFGQVTAPAIAPPISGAADKSGMSPDAKKAKAAECSKQADAKRLHGEARKKFRAECKKA